MADTRSLTDDVKISRFLYGGMLFVLAVLMAIRLATRGLDFISILLLGGTVAAVMIAHPALVCMMMVATLQSGLHLPGFGGLLSLAFLFQGIFVAWGLAATALRKESVKWDLSNYGVAIMIGTIFLLMLVRGFGMRMLGSADYGGRSYIEFLIVLFAFQYARRISIRRDQVRTLLWLYLIGSSLLIMAQIIIYNAPFLAPVIRRYMDTHTGYIGITGEGVDLRVADVTAAGVRWSGFQALGPAIQLLAFAFYAKRRSWFAGLLFVGMVMTAFSGFRHVLVSYVLTAGLFILIVSRYKGRVLLLGFVAAILSYGLLMVIGPHFPLTVQRALSFLPWVNWDTATVARAMGTVDWRLEVWKIAWRNLPQYLIVGRGFLLHDVFSHGWMTWSYYRSPEFYYATGGYHSGPLSLLVDTGIPGFIAFNVFMFGLCREAWRYVKRTAGHPDTFLRYLLIGLATALSYRWFHFYVFFGSVRSSIPVFLMLGVFMMLVGKALVRDLESRPQPDAPPPRRFA